MSGSVVLVLYILAILVVVLIHEAAHFGVAKAFGIKVEEFFVGFGPRLWSIKRGETEYGLKLLPLGGYVRIAGMNPFQEPTPEEYPRTFGAKPAWQRALVIAAGPLTHFVIAFLIFASFLGFVGEDRFEPVVGGVSATINGVPSPALEAGLEEGDRVVRVADVESPSQEEFQALTRAHVGEELELTLIRDGQELVVTVTPVVDRELGFARIGIDLDAGRELPSDREDFLGAVAGGADMVGDFTWAVLGSIPKVFGPEGLGRIVTLVFTDAERQVDDPATIVAGGQVAVAAANRGFAEALLLILGGFNIFVGIINLVPLPPFDGGHLAVLAVEKIRGKKVDPRKLVPLTAVMAGFLILFMVSLLYLDFVKPIPFP